MSESEMTLSLYFMMPSKSKDCRKLRSNVMGGETRDASKQRQRSAVKIRARAVVTLFVCKRHPLIPLVLDIT